jgi:hypothetical protein
MAISHAVVGRLTAVEPELRSSIGLMLNIGIGIAEVIVVWHLVVGGLAVGVGTPMDFRVGGRFRVGVGGKPMSAALRWTSVSGSEQGP